MYATPGLREDSGVFLGLPQALYALGQEMFPPAFDTLTVGTNFPLSPPRLFVGGLARSHGLLLFVEESRPGGLRPLQPI
jgi:hypothetical protein